MATNGAEARGLQLDDGVLDYLFGGLAPQTRNAPEQGDKVRHPSRVVAPSPQQALRQVTRETVLNDPKTQALLKTHGGMADADLLAEIRRQIEERKRRDNDRER